MGNHPNIDYDKWPKQNEYLGKPVTVIFHYDITHKFNGVVVRDDHEDPWVTIIKLDNGNYVLANECRWSPD